MDEANSVVFFALKNSPKIAKDQCVLCIFLCEFSQPGDKKRAGESNKWIFEILKKKSPYLT